jgi:hypothetical protein
MFEINLKSEVSVDYTKLRDLLQAQDCAEADIETRTKAFAATSAISVALN